MKHITTFLLILVASATFSQVVLTQNFSGGVMPPQGWSVSSNSSNWKISQTSNAGGVAPEGKLTWTPQFNALTRLISPPLNLTGNTKVILRFLHMIDHYSSSYQIGVSTRSGGSAGTWNNVWTRTVNSNVPAEEITIVIENSDVNKPDFQFSIFFNGNSYNLNDWFFDNFELLVPANRDGAVTFIDVPSYFFGPRTISGKISNFGIVNITSYTINWQADNGPVHSNSYTGLNIPTASTHTFQCTTPINLDPGTYLLKVWISHVNGIELDDIPENDMLTKSIGIASTSLQRRPLFEEFTSSTCAPCATFNNNVFNPFFQTYGSNIALIKYQMNWPGAGDPYYTAEGGVRRYYYGVNAVPQLFVEGKNVATNSSAVMASYNTGMADPAFVHISGQHIISGTHITVQASVLPYVHLNNVTMHIVVVEKTTYGNVGTNGETSFKHVMMKMLPDAYGTTMDFPFNTITTATYGHNMATTFVEQMDDLAVVIFVQDNTNKYVFQSAYSQETGAFISFYPTPGTTNFPTDGNVEITFSQPVRMIGGAEITNANVGTLVTFRMNDAGGPDVPFVATINQNKTTITVDPVNNLPSLTTFYVGISPVENTSGVATLPASVTFMTDIGIGIGQQTIRQTVIYPNPAADFIYVKNPGNKGQLIRVYDIHGRLVFEKENRQGASIYKIDIGSLKTGIYIVNITDDSGSINSKIHIIR